MRRWSQVGEVQSEDVRNGMDQAAGGETSSF